MPKALIDDIYKAVQEAYHVIGFNDNRFDIIYASCMIGDMYGPSGAPDSIIMMLQYYYSKRSITLIQDGMELLKEIL